MSKFQQSVASQFKDLKWRKKNLRNECNDRRDKLEFNNSQKFVHDFFTPKNKQKGILAYHTVGSGKTATAVYAGSGFEQDYQILWVTHFKLRNAMWKNIFGAMSAHPAMRNYQGTLPRNPGAKKRKFNKLSNKNWVPPMTYKQFSNALQNKNEVGHKLFKRNKRDPLKKTLVIIDEAHNLYNQDLPAAQKPDLNIITKMIHKSYKKSGDNSVKVILLSATPASNDIIGFAKMMNLLIPMKSKRLNTNLDSFLSNYFNSDFSKLSRKGKSVFKNLGKSISYLNISGDKNIFAQPTYILEKVKLTGNGMNIQQFKDLINEKEAEKKIIKEECTISFLNNNIREFKKLNMPTDMKVTIIKYNFPTFATNDIKILLDEADLKKSCNGMDRQSKKTCLGNIKQRVKGAKQRASAEAKKCKKDRSAENKEQIQNIKRKEKEFKSSQKMSMAKCDRIIYKDIANPIRRKSAEKRKLLCSKKATLWAGSYPTNFKFENIENFANNISNLRNDINENSPKIAKLLENIERLDRLDMANDNHTFKHIIYINDPGYYGMKIVMSALMANNFNYQTEFETYMGRGIGGRPGRMQRRLRLPVHIQNGPKNFMALAGTTIYRANFTKTLTRQILDTFNNRQNNIYGRKVRFILIDRNFLEGIDIFDVKYLHILDPYLFSTEMTQLIGRGTRTCGQSGLEFRNGWELKVIKYQSEIEGENVENKIKSERLNVMDINENVVKSRNLLDKALQEFASDQGLTQPKKFQVKKTKSTMKRLMKEFKQKQKQ